MSREPISRAGPPVARSGCSRRPLPSPPFKEKGAACFATRSTPPPLSSASAWPVSARPHHELSAIEGTRHRDNCYHCSVTVAPSWSRPDDAVRQAQLDAMKRRATGLLALAAAVFAGASVFEAQYPWLGYVRATAEASRVGGLADWFAVTALFRHPLGLPIPHTAIVPANWELMAQRVGTMVGDRVLTKDYVTHEISRFDIAELLARAAERIKPADLEAAVRAVARWAAEQVTPSATGDAALWLTRLARANPIAPLLATGIEISRKQGWDQRLIEAVAAALIEALDRPDFRTTVGDLVVGVLAGYRAQMGVYPRILMGLANTFGLIDRERLVTALHTALKKIADDPDDPLRRRLTETLAALPERLRTDPALADRVA